LALLEFIVSSLVACAYLQVYVLDGVFVGANDYTYLVKAMLVAAMLGTPLLLAVQPMNLGLVSDTSVDFPLGLY